MKQTTTATWRVIALASMMAASGHGMAALSSDSPSPRQEDYANYSQYIQALFHSWKMQEDNANSSGASTSCSNEKTEQEGSKSNSCAKNTSLISKTDIPGSDQYASLEEALDKRTADIRPDYNNTDIPRTSYNTFPLNPISSLDLEGVTAGDLLGVFNNLIYKGQTTDSANKQLTNNNRPSDDTTSTLYNDVTGALYSQIFDSVLALGGLVTLENSSGRVELSVAVIDGGLRLHLDADIYTSLFIVDRDGVPNTGFSHAGAINISSIGINIPNMTIDLKAQSSANINNIQIKAYTPDAITVDLSNTKIGVADALVDGTAIGQTSTVLSFGNDSVLTIGPGVELTTSLTPPDGLKTPLLTINGVVGSINLHDFALANQGQTIFHIGNISMDGLKLVDAKVFINGPKTIIDMGRGITNANLAVERFSIGGSPDVPAPAIGDFYASHISLVNSRITIQPH